MDSGLSRWVYVILYIYHGREFFRLVMPGFFFLFLDSLLRNTRGAFIFGLEWRRGELLFSMSLCVLPHASIIFHFWLEISLYSDELLDGIYFFASFRPYKHGSLILQWIDGQQHPLAATKAPVLALISNSLSMQASKELHTTVYPPINRPISPIVHTRISNPNHYPHPSPPQIRISQSRFFYAHTRIHSGSAVANRTGDSMQSGNAWDNLQIPGPRRKRRRKRRRTYTTSSKCGLIGFPEP